MTNYQFSVGAVFYINDSSAPGSWRIEDIVAGSYVAKALDFLGSRTFTLKELEQALAEGRLRFHYPQIPGSKARESKPRRSDPDKRTTTPNVNRPDHPDFSLVNPEYQPLARFRYAVILPLFSEAHVTDQRVSERISEVRANGELERCVEALTAARHDVERKQTRATLRNPERRKPLPVGLSPRSVKRWLQAYRVARDIRVLVPKYANCGRGDHVEEDLTEIIVDRLRQDRLRANAMSFRTIAETVYGEIEEHNGEVLPEDRIRPRKILTLTQLVRRMCDAGFTKYEVTEARYGEAAARALFNPNGLQYRARYIFERLEIDHTKLDILCVDEKDRLPIGRPTLTFAVDRKSGYPAGYHVSYEPPSYLSVSHCLYHTFLPKSGLRERFPDLQHDWLASGVWDTIVCDNGAEFTGYDLPDAGAQLRFEIDWCPPAVPWFKASVERRFGSINKELLHHQDGTTFSNILARGQYDPSKHGCLTIDELDEMLAIYFVDYYPGRTIRRLGGRPYDLFEEGLRIREPRYPDSADSARILLGKVAERTVTSHGINLENLTYNSREFAPLVGTKNGPVKVKYDPGDLSRIWVLDPRPGHQRFITAISNELEYTSGLSLWKHRQIVHYARVHEEGDDIPDLVRARNKMQRIAETSFTKTRRTKTRMALQRFREEGRSPNFVPGRRHDLALPAQQVSESPSTGGARPVADIHEVIAIPQAPVTADMTGSIRRESVAPPDEPHGARSREEPDEGDFEVLRIKPQNRS